MITGELKNRIDGLWDVFAAGGLVNPLDVIEQVTYLMFIRDLDDTDNLRAKEAAMLGLSYKSIFADEVEIGDRKVDGNQLIIYAEQPCGYSDVVLLGFDAADPNAASSYDHARFQLQEDGTLVVLTAYGAYTPSGGGFYEIYLGGAVFTKN